MKTLFFLLLSAASAFSVKKEAPKFLTIEPARSVSVKAGSSVVTTITVNIDPVFHIQANPVSQPNLIPTTIDFSEKDGMVLENVTYPEGKTFRLENSDKDLMVYGGEAKFKVKFHAKNAKPGRVDMVGTFKFQPCNSTICFFPTRYELKVPVQVVK
jgi:hypothetical protein